MSLNALDYLSATFSEDSNQIANNQQTTSAVIKNQEIPVRYEGGTLNVPIKPNDTQRSFVWRGNYQHAIAAGLNKQQAKEFADAWDSPAKTFNHRGNGNVPYTDAEFRALKTKGEVPFNLEEEYDAAILADLNARIESNQKIRVETNIYTTEERAALEQQKNETGQDAATVKNKPILTMIDASTKDGKPLSEDTALTRYIQCTYNQDGRVWGDKINEMVSLAKTQGVKVDVQINEDGTALVGISEADKAKLDHLFNQALGDTIKGEEAGAKGQREATLQAADIPITLVNTYTKAVEGLLNLPATLEAGAKIELDRRLRPDALIFMPELDKQIPRFSETIPAVVPQADLSAALIPNQSDLFNKTIDGRVDPNGQTLGKTTSTAASVAVPLPLANLERLEAAADLAKTISRSGGELVGRVERFGQEAAEGMRIFGQSSELATANGAPTIINSADNIKGSNVFESRANGFPGKRIPSSGGSWDGAVGNSGWSSTKAEVIAATKGKPIPYKNGFPDFSEWSRGEVKLPKMVGDHQIDFKEADKLFAQQKRWFKPDGTPDWKKVETMRETDKLTWHHHEDMTTMQLVPKDINNEVAHTGGASLVKRAGKTKP